LQLACKHFTPTTPLRYRKNYELYNIIFSIVPQCESNLSNMKNLIQRQNFENIICQMRTIESRLVLLNEKLSKRFEKESRSPSPWHGLDNSQISKTDLLVEVAQLKARNQKCVCGHRKGLLTPGIGKVASRIGSKYRRFTAYHE
jgi:hypothetical protein